MNKATIKKEIKPDGRHFFNVYKDDAFHSCVCYLPNEPSDSKLGEKLKYQEALRMAKIIESGKESIFETVYETPENSKDDIPEDLYTQLRQSEIL